MALQKPETTWLLQKAGADWIDHVDQADAIFKGKFNDGMIAPAVNRFAAYGQYLGIDPVNGEDFITHTFIVMVRSDF